MNSGSMSGGQPAESTASQSKLFETGVTWTYEDCARFFGVTRRTIEKLVSRRKIPTLRIGRSVRFIPADVIAWSSKEGAKRR